MADFNAIKFQGNRSLLKEVTADKLNAILQEIRRVRPLPGRGITTRQEGQGTRIDLAARFGGGSTVAATASHPFKILSTTVDGTPKLGVYQFSYLGTANNSPTTAIDGLLAADPIAEDDANLFAVPDIGEKIWLQIGTADPANPDDGPQLWEATTTIKFGAVGDTEWPDYPSPVAVNNDDPEAPFQEFYNVLLAEVTDYETDPRPASLTVAVEDEQRQITQCWSSNICVAHWVINGLLCLVPSDPSPDYPASALA